MAQTGVFDRSCLVFNMLQDAQNGAFNFWELTLNIVQIYPVEAILVTTEILGVLKKKKRMSQVRLGVIEDLDTFRPKERGSGFRFFMSGMLRWRSASSLRSVWNPPRGHMKTFAVKIGPHGTSV